MTTELTHFHLDVSDDGIATVLLDVAGERMNTIGPMIFEDFVTVLDRLETDDSIRAVVLGSAKSDNFLAGADIRMFAMISEPAQAEEVVRSGQELLARLEALHTEQEQAGDRRHPRTMPGRRTRTGTHRVDANRHRSSQDPTRPARGEARRAAGRRWHPTAPRAHRGCRRALDLILTGRSLRAGRAHKLGLVDEVVPPQVLLEVAQTTSAPGDRERTGSNADTQQELALSGDAPAARPRADPDGTAHAVQQGRGEDARGDPRQLPGTGTSPARAVRIGVEEGHEAGYDAEARVLRRAGAHPRVEGAAVDLLRRSDAQEGDLGAGRRRPKAGRQGRDSRRGPMGGGIAAVSTIRAGTTTRIKEIDDAGVGRGLAYVRKVLDGQVKRRRMRPVRGRTRR